MQLIVNGLLTQYELAGQGKVVLLLHGWGDTGRGFAQLQRELARRYQTVTIDLPGFGGTAPPPAAWGLDEYARFISAALKKLELVPYVIIGHSNGGAVAIRGLGERLFAAERLVLIASAGIRGTGKGRIRAIRSVTKVGKALSAPLPSTVKKRLRRKVYQAVGSDMLVAEHLEETFKKVVTDDVQADAVAVRQPTLLIYGENDQATPVRYGEKFHELITGSTLEILPGAGHFVHLERPEAVLKAIEEFLQ